MRLSQFFYKWTEIALYIFQIRISKDLQMKLTKSRNKNNKQKMNNSFPNSSLYSKISLQWHQVNIMQILNLSRIRSGITNPELSRLASMIIIYLFQDKVKHKPIVNLKKTIILARYRYIS